MNTPTFNIAITLPALLCVWSSLPATGAQPQPDPPRLEWFTIDAGGGRSSGGNFSLCGTLGQPDAGGLSGGHYRLIGGFWGIVLRPQEPDPEPALRIHCAGSSVIISWSGSATGFQLEEKMSLDPSVPWTVETLTPVVMNGENTVTLPATGATRYYRLSRP
jgi:hypothetical protein